MLLRQGGEADRGWRGLPFWWPIIVTPRSAVTAIFATAELWRRRQRLAMWKGHFQQKRSLDVIGVVPATKRDAAKVRGAW